MNRPNQRAIKSSNTNTAEALQTRQMNEFCNRIPPIADIRRVVEECLQMTDTVDEVFFRSQDETSFNNYSLRCNYDSFVLPSGFEYCSEGVAV